MEQLPVSESFMYQLWLSKGPLLTMLLPYTIPSDKPFRTALTSDTTLDLSDRIIIPDTIDPRYCGTVIVIVKLDTRQQLREIDEDNNMKQVPRFLQCEGGKYVDCLVAFLKLCAL